MKPYKSITTPGGRTLRKNYVVAFLDSLDRWVVGVGNFWTGKRRTSLSARKIAKRLNDRKARP
ncbi:hypothetical protein [Caudoviricetes sp.]|nr:hypothetical protein [Caudoviricetes sp.]